MLTFRSEFQWHAPDTSRHPFRARLAWPARTAVRHREPRMPTNGCLRHAPQHLACLGTHRQHRLHEKALPAFVADLSHAADGCRRWDRSMSVVSCTKSFTGEAFAWSLVWCRCGCIKAAKNTSGSSSLPIQGFGLCPGLHFAGAHRAYLLALLPL